MIFNTIDIIKPSFNGSMIIQGGIGGLQPVPGSRQGNHPGHHAGNQNFMSLGTRLVDDGRIAPLVAWLWKTDLPSAIACSGCPCITDQNWSVVFSGPITCDAAGHCLWYSWLYSTCLKPAQKIMAKDQTRIRYAFGPGDPGAPAI